MTQICPRCKRVVPNAVTDCSMGGCPYKTACDGDTPPLLPTSDGSTASYYELPEGATELQHLISYKNMNAQVGEMFRACYRMGEEHHSDPVRDLNKIIFYAQAEIERIKKYG